MQLENLRSVHQVTPGETSSSCRRTSVKRRPRGHARARTQLAALDHAQYTKLVRGALSAVTATIASSNSVSLSRPHLSQENLSCRCWREPNRARSPADLKHGSRSICCLEIAGRDVLLDHGQQQISAFNAFTRLALEQSLRPRKPMDMCRFAANTWRNRAKATPRAESCRRHARCAIEGIQALLVAADHIRRCSPAAPGPDARADSRGLRQVTRMRSPRRAARTPALRGCWSASAVSAPERPVSVRHPGTRSPRAHRTRKPAGDLHPRALPSVPAELGAVRRHARPTATDSPISLALVWEDSCTPLSVRRPFPCGGAVQRMAVAPGALGLGTLLASAHVPRGLRLRIGDGRVPVGRRASRFQIFRRIRPMPTIG
jgi:hypothetical protein